MFKKLPSFNVGATSASSQFARLIVFIAALLFSGSSFAQLQLLKDVDENEEHAYNEYTSLTHGSGRMYYLVNGNELWKSNGTPESTLRLKEFKSASNLTLAGSTLYFTADDGVSGMELWKSGGTVGTTVRVKDIMPGEVGSTPAHLTSVNNILFFSAYNKVGGTELYKSDGTSAGTVLVKDLGPGSSNPKNMVNANGVLYFSATTSMSGYELWKSDGTAANTVMIKEISVGKNSSDPQYLTYCDGKVYFSAYDPAQGRELWSSDGTAGGTLRVSDIRAGIASSTPRNLITIGSRLFFTAHDGIHGDELWRTDGTSAGTVLVKDMNPGVVGSNSTNHLKTPMRDFTNINGQLYFVAAKGATEYIYRSDGTAAGTIIIQKVTGPGGDVYQPEFTYMNGYLYFFNGGEYYSEDQVLFRMPYKGSPSEISFIKTLGLPYNFDYEPVPLRNEMIHFYNNVYFFARFSFNDNSYGGFELIKSNGTTEGTVSVHDSFITTYGSRPREMIKGNSLIYMNQYSILSYTPELYRTDGTPEGTFELMPGRYHLGWGTVGDRLYFVTEGSDYDIWLLMRTDGTAATTQAVTAGLDIYGPSVPKNLTGIGNLLYYTNDLRQLWKTDGTDQGTVMVKTNTLVLHISSTGMILTSTYGNLELWKTTSGGLALIKNFGAVGVGPSTTKIGNTFYFSVNTSDGAQVWRSDGTAAGTYRLGGPSPYDVWNKGSVRQMIAFNDQVYFFSGNTYGASSLFRVNSRTSIDEIAELPVPNHYAVTSTRMILFASTGTTIDAYSSDGQSFEGTTHLGQMEMGDFIPNDFKTAVVGDYVYFNSLHHEPMWRTDGTVCGTYPLDLGTTENYALESLGNDLIFGGYALKTGVEPYVYRNVNAVQGTPACDQTMAVVAMSAKESKDLEDLAYPNPFNTSFTLTIASETDEQVDVDVYTVYGMPVETLSKIRTNTNLEAGTSWPKGRYILKVKTSKGTTTHHVIKK